MTIDIARVRTARSQRLSARFCAWSALLGAWYLGGCSLQSFSDLTNGGATGLGGEQSVGGTGETQGGNATNAGASSTGGATSAGGASNAGGITSEGGATSSGGVSNTGGIASGGTSSANTAVPIGGSNTTGCAFAQTGGQLLVPPSQGFETALQGWTTTSQKTSALSRKPGNGLNCEGDWYVTVDGAQRSAAWDGAMLEVNSLVTVGHTYRYSIAVRQSPTGYAVTAQNFKLTISRTCVSTVYDDILPQVAVQTDWVRLTKEFTLSLPGDCTTALNSVKLYVATYEPGPSSFISFDIDDFKLIDLTPGASGTGGAPSFGGASSTAGAPSTGGALGTGGAPSSGGITSTGGNKSSGGSQTIASDAGADAG